MAYVFERRFNSTTLVLIYCNQWSLETSEASDSMQDAFGRVEITGQMIYISRRIYVSVYALDQIRE